MHPAKKIYRDRCRIMSRLAEFDAIIAGNADLKTKYPMCQACTSFHRTVFGLEGLPPEYGLCHGCFNARNTLLEMAEIHARLDGLTTTLEAIKNMLECAPPPTGPEYLKAKRRFQEQD